MTVMDIKRYFYNEEKERLQHFTDCLKERCSEREASLCELQDEELRQGYDILEESGLLTPPEEVITVVNPLKVNQFAQLTKKSIDLAKAVCANVHAYIIDMEGYIDLTAENLLFDHEEQLLFNELVSKADAVSISKSVDVEQGLPSDVEDGVTVSLWYDLYIESVSQ